MSEEKTTGLTLAEIAAGHNGRCFFRDAIGLNFQFGDDGLLWVVDNESDHRHVSRMPLSVKMLLADDWQYLDDPSEVKK